MFLLLISAGADLSKNLKTGINCLHLAAQSNNVKVVHYLLSSQLFDVDSVDDNGCTALHWACLEGSYDVVKYLLAAKADPNLQTYQAKSTPLHIAIQALEYSDETRTVYKLATYRCETEARDAEDKMPADYIVNIEDEDVQQEVLRILASAQAINKKSRCCGKKYWLIALLTFQTVASLIYLYPMLYLLYGKSFGNLILISLGALSCLTFMITMLFLLYINPGKLHPLNSRSYSVSSISTC